MSDHSHEHAPSGKLLVLILGATFVFGCITGVILFLQNNTGKDGDGAITVNTKGFTIMAYMYGGCTRGGGCPSYRISENGAYMFMIRDQNLKEKRFEDVLSGKQTDSLETELSRIDFPVVSGTVFAGTCPSDSDGVAYRYEITYKGERHTFDSCVEALEGNALFRILEDYFKIFWITHKTK